MVEDKIIVKNDDKLKVDIKSGSDKSEKVALDGLLFDNNSKDYNDIEIDNPEIVPNGFHVCDQDNNIVIKIKTDGSVKLYRDIDEASRIFWEAIERMFKTKNVKLREEIIELKKTQCNKDNCGYVDTHNKIIERINELESKHSDMLIEHWIIIMRKGTFLAPVEKWCDFIYEPDKWFDYSSHEWYKLDIELGILKSLCDICFDDKVVS